MRIVSLCPSLTELVCDLGGGRDLVGVTRYCIHPAEELRGIEQVGGTKDPDVERIAALRPSLVLLNEEENRWEDAERLEAAGLRCLITRPKTVAGTAAMVREIGAALERPEAAEGIARDIEARGEAARQSAAGAPVVSWAYLIWRKPWMTVNRDTYIHSLLTLPGGRNVFADLPDRYPAVTAEEIAARDPGVVFLSSEPFPFAAKHADELAATTGLPRERFVLADGELLSWHGSRTPAGIDYARELLGAARRADEPKGKVNSPR